MEEMTYECGVLQATGKTNVKTAQQPRSEVLVSCTGVLI